MKIYKLLRKKEKNIYELIGIFTNETYATQVKRMYELVLETEINLIKEEIEKEAFESIIYPPIIKQQTDISEC